MINPLHAIRTALSNEPAAPYIETDCELYTGDKVLLTNGEVGRIVSIYRPNCVAPLHAIVQQTIAVGPHWFDKRTNGWTVTIEGIYGKVIE